MAPEVSRENRRSWFWTQFVMALGLIAVGLFFSCGGFLVSPVDVPVGMAFFVGGSLVAFAGVVWLLMLFVHRTQYVMAFSLILFGALSWFEGLGVGLGVGDRGDRSASWVVPIATGFFVAGPFIALAGVAWLLLLSRRANRKSN
jgi:hypothetical protein